MLRRVLGWIKGVGVASPGGVADEALRQSQEQHRNLFENAPIGIYRTTPEGRILMANPMLVRTLGYTSFDDLTSRNLEKEGFEPAHLRSQFRALLEQQGEVKGLESVWMKRDNTPIFVRENARVIRGADGAVLYYEGTVEDISERRQAEEALRESEKRYRTLFEDNPNPMWVYDIETLGFLAVNEAAVAHYGYTRRAFLAMTIKDLRPAEDVPALMDNLAMSSSRLQRSGFWRHQKRDGSLIDVEIISHEIQFGGRSARLVLVTDITERRRAEEALKESHQRLQETLAELQTLQEQMIQQERLRALG